MFEYPETLRDLEKISQQCEQCQHEVLLDILSYAEDTEIAKKYNFKSIRSVEDFQKSVPFTRWKDYKYYSNEMQNGREDILFKGKPPFFICTSGTTGKIKYIPESEKGRMLKSIVSRLRIKIIEDSIPSESDSGKILPIVNHAVEGYTKAGIMYGSASGITLMNVSDKTKKQVAFPLELLEVDYDNKYIDYFIMRFAIAEDVRIILGNNAQRIVQLIQTVENNSDMLINDIKNGTLSFIETLSQDLRQKIQKYLKPNPSLAERFRKSKRLLPDIYWPNLSVVACWLSGSVGRYVDNLKKLVSCSFFDVGYGASEGKFNIPVKPNSPSGVLSIFSVFYEFKDVKTGEILLAHQLQEGKSYEMFITTYSGLYRYEIGDIIKVDGFLGTTPLIHFESKTGEILNLCGEKIAVSSLIKIIDRAIAQSTNRHPTYWCVKADEENNNYHFFIEVEDFEPSKTSKTLIAERLEEMMLKDTLIYSIFRKQGLIYPLKVTIMKTGWHRSLYEKLSKGRSAQVKLSLICKNVDENFIYE